MFFYKQDFCVQKCIIPKGQHRVKVKKKQKKTKNSYSITAVRQFQDLTSTFLKQNSKLLNNSNMLKVEQFVFFFFVYFCFK